MVRQAPFMKPMLVHKSFYFGGILVGWACNANEALERLNNGDSKPCIHGSAQQLLLF